ncbi:MAG: proteasome activator [Actinomycetota bacterium]
MTDVSSHPEGFEPDPTLTEIASTEVEVVDPAADDDVDETVDHPAKVMRIGAMMKQLLEELRSMELDEPSRDRLRDIYDTSVSELGAALSPDLRDELGRLALPFSADETPSGAELQIAKAQLVGWLEGLVQGMQAMLFAQQMAAQQQLQSMRGELGTGAEAGFDGTEPPPGTYL